MASGVSPSDSQFFFKFVKRMGSHPICKFKKKFLNG